MSILILFSYNDELDLIILFNELSVRFLITYCFIFSQYSFFSSLHWQIKKSITVGIIGLPNVGKSSLINSLKRCHVVNVGATPGLTRSLQEVQLDKNVKLLDCPGVVMLKSQENDASIALRNCKRIEKLDDPVSPGS